MNIYARKKHHVHESDSRFLKCEGMFGDEIADGMCLSCNAPVADLNDHKLARLPSGNMPSVLRPSMFE